MYALKLRKELYQVSRFYVYNASRERVGLLQNLDSVQWLENYQAAGEVKICARLTVDNLAMLVEGNRVFNTDSDTVARITHVDLDSANSQEIITARADLTAELLSDRVVMATESVKNVESGMYSIYSKNRRNLPIEISTVSGYTEITDTEITWSSVLDGETNLAKVSGLGFKVVFDPESAV